VGQVRAAFTARVTDADRAEALSLLSPPLQGLFLRMSVRDQRHSMEVLRRLDAASRADPILAQAALLHDAGKADAYLGVPGRTMLVLGEAAGAIGLVQRLPLIGARIARYRRHPETGARLLAQAGADSRLVEIVREHQAKHPRMPETLTLQAADGRE
jgi:putative nucleotidyltransferase with HDIG domain